VSVTSAKPGDLLPGTTYHYRVIASATNGVTKGVDMTFATSSVASLGGLALDGGTLVPGFDPQVSHYDVMVPNTAGHLRVSPVAKDPAASVKVNGIAVAGGEAVNIALAEGMNTVAVVVTAADGIITHAYTIKVMRWPTNYVFKAATDVPATVGGCVASGSTATLALGFAPPTGTNLMVVKNTGSAFIKGNFGNLAHGQAVNLTYGGISYPFVANYFGGTGNDLVLEWANRRLLSWGLSDSGQLGTGTLTNSNVPVAVDMTGVLAAKVPLNVSAGASHSLALCADGTVVAWGYNYDGQLGNGSTNNSPMPVAVSQTGALAGKTVIAVKAGSDHSLALCSDGTLVAWGGNSSGQLGNGRTSSSTQPVAVDQTGVLAGKTVTALAAGYNYSLVLCSDGTMAAWGSNSGGALGNGGGITYSSVPVLVDCTGVLVGKTVTGISAGGSSYHESLSFAVCSDGTVAGWGINGYGQLGNGSTISSNVPVAVTQSGVLAGKTVVAAAVEEYASVFLCSNGLLAASGMNSYGQLGNSSFTYSSVPVLVNQSGVLSGRTVAAIAGGGGHALALCLDGTLAAWGYNGYGQLGNPTTTASNAPVLVNTSTLNTGERFTAITGGYNHSLALTASPPPVATTLAASGISGAGATLNGAVNPRGLQATVAFSYGLTNAYGSTMTATPATVSGTASVAVSARLSGLEANTVYHYRLAVTAAGVTTYGSDATFTTGQPALLSLAPSTIAITVPSGDSVSRNLSVNNSGPGAGEWSLEVVDANGRGDNMAGALAAVMDSGTSINGSLPNRFDFTEGESGTAISNGGTGGTPLFSPGNKLSTSLGGPIAYSDGLVSTTASLGTGGSYFTKKLPGLFVFGADPLCLRFPPDQRVQHHAQRPAMERVCRQNPGLLADHQPLDPGRPRRIDGDHGDIRQRPEAPDLRFEWQAEAVPFVVCHIVHGHSAGFRFRGSGRQVAGCASNASRLDLSGGSVFRDHEWRREFPNHNHGKRDWDSPRQLSVPGAGQE
jgi:alpha-tubulin suppressor-like RCC1 family protein